ncbi:alpha/beta hydrolase [Catellatospora sichuanensis]|uniref:alpha/beta hydrolase n=1 Tax=Catellatospora sichuanensis TaxID=1969805 RepID=UPI00118393B4|nr:alpha/beta hydrolase [Catellatospora sichuanensis]
MAHGIQPFGDVRILSCLWGDRLGASLGRTGSSIPAGLSERGVEGIPDDIAIWAALEHDPLFELDMLGTEQRHAELPPGTTPALPSVRADVERMARDPAVRADLADAGLDAHFFDAADEVLSSAPARTALSARPSAQTRAALSRALVAAAMRRAENETQGPLFLDGDHRDALVELVAARLGGASDRGQVGERAVAAAKRLATDFVVSRKVDRSRLLMTRQATSVAGDVLVYLSRGTAIREYLAETLAGIDDEVVVLGHSLGGVIAFDLLCQRPCPNVTALVTVGSQIPYLYELDALPGLALHAEDRLPPHFTTPWHNVFDRRDVLAFTAAPIFGAQVTDWEIDSRTTFPRSHSAYFGNRRFFQVLAVALGLA